MFNSRLLLIQFFQISLFVKAKDFSLVLAQSLASVLIVFALDFFVNTF
jgi:hypothetical protein